MERGKEMKLIENWEVMIQCPHCKKEIEVMPATKDMLKILIKKGIDKQ